MLLVLEGSEVINGDAGYVQGGSFEGWPQDGTMTQIFNDVSVTKSMHTGIDLGVAYVPVYAPAEAVVDGIYTWGTFGNWIVLYHGYDERLLTDVFSVYAHLSEFWCAVGDRVGPGTPIAKSGNSGLSTGPHIHWGFSRDKYISGLVERCYDPYIFIKRAQEELNMMAEYERGLLAVANGDFKTMLSSYDTLDAAGFFAQVNKSDGVAPPYNPADDTATELNSSLVRSKRISFLACDHENGPKAWKLING